MNGRNTNPRALATRQQRIEWLAQRPELWRDIDLTAPYKTQREMFWRIAREMKDAGLLAETTSAQDAGISKMVVALRNGVCFSV